jgi:hypothetical protein
MPGTIENSEPKTVRGAQVYAFEIRNKKGKVIDVWINQTGKLVHRSAEKSARGKG